MSREYSLEIRRDLKTTPSNDMIPSAEVEVQTRCLDDMRNNFDGMVKDDSQLHGQGKVRFDQGSDRTTVDVPTTRATEDIPSQGYSSASSTDDTKTKPNNGGLSPTLGRENQNPFADPESNVSLAAHTTIQTQRLSGGVLEELSEPIIDQKVLVATQESVQRVKANQLRPISRSSSFEDIEEEWRPLRRAYPVSIDIPMTEIEGQRAYVGATSDDEEKIKMQSQNYSPTEARRLVDPYTGRPRLNMWQETSLTTTGFISGQTTPIDEKREMELESDTQQYRSGILSSLLKLYNAPELTPLKRTDSTTSVTPSTFHSSRISRRNKKNTNTPNESEDNLSSVTEASANFYAQGESKTPIRGRLCMSKRMHSNSLLGSARSKFTGRPRLEDEIRITVHIAETLSRQNYLLKLCRALMTFGAPTHRLEEYMRMSARVLEVPGQFLYLPGCMIISFEESASHTAEVKLVKAVQGVNLGLLQDIHEIYKEVVHDVIGVEEATQRLDRLNCKKPKNNPWVLVIVHGLASASVAPFAFEARYIDMPVCFLLGCLLGFLQLIIAPKSELYSNVFEITASVLTSFLARAFGSIQDGNLFCFSAMAQSSIALILPGYMVLCGSLELQSRLMVAGSVRMVYAIIYSLFLGFGITIGTAFYGLLDDNATSATTCAKPGMSDIEKWAWVPVFTLCLCIINQAKWRQTPVMLLIGFAGYIVNFLSAKRLPSSAQISNTLGALTVGVLGNLYSRMRHGVAAAALLPAIFVQVPSGLAASGSLLAGLSSAEKITNTTSSTNVTAQINGTNNVPVTSAEDLNTIVFNVGYSMIQIAVGITVGLFMSALIVYPFGKRRSGLFTF